ncbi:MAG: hypothetical protein DRG37_07475 [Deltaproteobacteria bacterium]|nr:MAG: hypothetical protein DRG37_07475 [Deltaproteobacteria bacterium]
MLNNISTGVISINNKDCISMINPSAQKMLSIKTKKVLGRPFMEVLKEEHIPIAEDIVNRLKEAKGGLAERQITLSLGDKKMTLMTHASLLYDHNNEYMGMVLVFDDLTQLQKMQRMAAWREVARRIAHEVKNPLTPIQLSAQRLRRRYLDKLEEDRDVFDECTRIIIEQVDDMKHLVDEFSAFAKMPSAMPVPDDLNIIIRETVALYKQAHPQVEYLVEIDSGLPQLELDRSQIKRAIVNLLENATTAVEEDGNSLKKITVRTAYNPQLRIASIQVIDTGPGIPRNAKDRLFEPYFSTKKGGTGLGLAIVSRIVTDHNGFIRVRQNHPRGTIFTIELPVRG